MSWVEVDGARWRRMHGLAIPVGESWVEVERSQVEVVAVEQGGGEWGWVEIDGPGWRWVYGLAIPNYIQKTIIFRKNSIVYSFLKLQFAVESIKLVTNVRFIYKHSINQ